MARQSKDILLAKIRNGERLSFAEQLSLTFTLSLPAILAQFSTVMMQYIDASMVGHLGANQSASIGIVSTSTWIFGGFCMAATSGFSVQVAHLIGANEFSRARGVLRQALSCVLIFVAALTLIGAAIAAPLPRWLGGTPEICGDASGYFLIYTLFLPFMQIAWTCGAMLQASGNMKTPAILNILMCVMDVIFNYIFIYTLDMGVRGAALGTGLAEAVTAALMLYAVTVRSPELRLNHEKGSFRPQKECIRTALGISSPMWLQNLIMRGAYVAGTIIVAPLGAIAIAANAFAVTAESFCYMPGYGLEEAATTLVGQSRGAGRKDIARRFGYITTAMGSLTMTFLAVLMYAFAPQLMGLLSSDAEVVALGARVLRIEAFAETLYGASIVAYGAFVGAGDTLVPSIMNFMSMWVVRIGLALWLTPLFGLTGYWIAMCIELNFRGLIFLVRLKGKKWLSKSFAINVNLQQ